jgi:cyclic pyranopterin phosphate synthase
MNDLTHFDESGRPRMVDVSDKDEAVRKAIASGCIRMEQETLRRIRHGEIAKGNVLSVASVAAVMGAKKTPELIPMCHPLLLSGVNVAFADMEDGRGLRVEVTVNCNGRTGVEMEALTSVSAALLTIYDMCKAIDKAMEMTDIRLEEKLGGGSGHWSRPLEPAMRLRGLFFGALAEKRQERQRELEMAHGVTLHGLLSHLGIDSGLPMVLAVNCQIVSDHGTALLDGDEVAVMPVFSGG